MFTQLTDFCKKNIPVIITIAITTFFTYGFMLFNSVIGVDTDGAMSAYKTTMFDFGISIGRWGGEFLYALSHIMPYNPHIAVFCSLCYLGLSALLWCALFDVFSKGFKGSNVGKILFSVLYITSPVWNEFMYFHPSVLFFSQTLCPVTIYFIFKGIQDKKLWQILVGTLLATFLFSVNQALIPLLCSAVLICFFLQSTTGNFSFNTVIKVLIVFVVAYLLYTVIDLLIKAIYDVQASGYVDNFNKWKARGIGANIKHILKIGYEIVYVPFKQNNYTLYGSMVLLPLGLLFLLNILRRNRITVVLGLCVVFSVMLLPVLGANRPPLRSMFVLPLVTGFLPLFLYNEWFGGSKMLRNAVKIILVIFVACVSLYQAQIAIQVQYSDYRRHNADVRLAGILDERIQEALLSGEFSDTTGIIKSDIAPQAIPVAIFGKYHPFYFDKNYIRGEVSGWSIFEWDTQWDTIFAPTRRGVRFMQTQGMNYIAAPDEITLEAAEFAKSMPAYPAKDCVKRYKGIIVVKLSL
jgi:hypothetical protein